MLETTTDVWLFLFLDVMIFVGFFGMLYYIGVKNK